MTVADRIKNMREAAGLTQEELAKRVGYKDKTSISKIENSGDEISLKKVKKIASALSVSFPSLMGWDSSPNNPLQEARDKFQDNPLQQAREAAIQEERYKSVEFYNEHLKGKTSYILAPVLGRVAAGIPIEMVTEVLDTEELDPNDFPPGDYFGLVIKGNSMEPKISEGDVVIVRQQDDVESGQIAIVTINGDDATCKRVMKYGSNLRLVSFNPNYEPMQFSAEDVENLPVKIIGRVVELRAKF